MLEGGLSQRSDSMHQSSGLRESLQFTGTPNCKDGRLSSRSEMLRAFTSHLSAMCRL